MEIKFACCSLGKVLNGLPSTFEWLNRYRGTGGKRWQLDLKAEKLPSLPLSEVP